MKLRFLIIVAALAAGCAKSAAPPPAPAPAMASTAPMPPAPPAPSPVAEAPAQVATDGAPRSSPARPAEGEVWLTAREALAKAAPAAKKALPAARLVALSQFGFVHAGMADDASSAGTDLATGKARVWLVDWCVPGKPKCARVDVMDGDASEAIVMDMADGAYAALPTRWRDSTAAVSCLRRQLAQPPAGTLRGGYALERAGGRLVVTKAGEQVLAADDLAVYATLAVADELGGRAVWALRAETHRENEDGGEVVGVFLCDARTAEPVPPPR